MRTFRTSEIVMHGVAAGITDQAEARKSLERAEQKRLEAQLTAFNDLPFAKRLEALDDLLHVANQGNYGTPPSREQANVRPVVRAIWRKVERLYKADEGSE